MKEKDIHHFWASAPFASKSLLSLEGDKIQIIDPGKLNEHSGPDFFNAHITINGRHWFGNIEIHIHSSDYHAHGHQSDESYSNLILHVVWKQNKDLHLKAPTLVVSDYVGKAEIEVHALPAFGAGEMFQHWKEENIHHLIHLRLQRKSKTILEHFQQCKGDWQETFYRVLCINHGFHVNDLPFEMLSRSLPYSTLRPYLFHPMKLEALFLGQSSLMQRKKSVEQEKLTSEYEIMCRKHGLNPIKKSLWKHMRLRPSNFPSVRINQLMGILHANPFVSSQSLDAESVDDLSKIFYDHDSHSDRFKKHAAFGLENIMINTIIPFRQAFENIHGNKSFKSQSLSMLSIISPEKNGFLKSLAQYGLIPKNALESQALLELKRAYNF